MARQRKGPPREYLQEPTQVLVRLEAQAAERIKELAEAEGLSQSGWIRRALDAALAEAPKKKPPK